MYNSTKRVVGIVNKIPAAYFTVRFNKQMTDLNVVIFNILNIAAIYTHGFYYQQVNLKKNGTKRDCF